ncbi:MAG: cysteine hydrolase [Rhodospirillaceae bacterium]
MSDTESLLWPESIARVEAQNGKKHRISDLNPAETALVVVDMQDFYLQEASTNFCPQALEIVENINNLAGVFREAGSPVIWLRNILGNRDLKGWSAFYDHLSKERLDYRKRELSKDGAGFKLFNGLDVRSSDHKINKTRFSAFSPGSSNIERVLGEHGAEVLVICGIVTNVCVESTVRDAMMLNYEVLVAEDSCASSNPRAHEASLNTMYTHFADVMMTSKVIDILNSGAKDPGTAA